MTTPDSELAIRTMVTLPAVKWPISYFTTNETLNSSDASSLHKVKQIARSRNHYAVKVRDLQWVPMRLDVLPPIVLIHLIVQMGVLEM